MMLTENFIYLCTHFKETSETKMSKPSITLTGILKNLPQRRFFLFNLIWFCAGISFTCLYETGIFKRY